MLKLLFASVLLLCVTSAFSFPDSCEKNVGELVENHEFAKAYEIYSKCIDKENPEQLFALAVMHVNSKGSKLSLDKNRNILIVGYLKKATLSGHKQSRLLLADILNDDEYVGIVSQAVVASCLKEPEKPITHYRGCLQSNK